MEILTIYCSLYKHLLRAPFRDEWRGLLGLATRRSHADKRIPSAPRSSSSGPHSGQHAAVLRPEDFPLRSLPVLSSAAGEMYLLPPGSTTTPSFPQRPARCISCRRGARRSRPLLSGRRDVSLAAAEHDDPVLFSAAGEMYLLPRRSTTTGRRATLLLLTLVSIFCCPAHCDRSSSPPHKCNVHPPCLYTQATSQKTLPPSPET